MIKIVAASFLAGLFSYPLVLRLLAATKSSEEEEDDILWNGAVDLIGNTPLIRLPILSKALGYDILAKCEFLNPGGSPKDRVALSILSQIQKENLDSAEKVTVYEGTVGSTGISLAWLSKRFGFKCHIVMPDDQALEKYSLLEKLGATVEKVRPVGIVDSGHYVNRARTLAASQNEGRGYFCDQFENPFNSLAHYRTTAPELHSQTHSNFQVLILGAGTGGTLAGCTRYLKPLMPGLKVVLADPEGSGLLNKVRHGVFFNVTEKEGLRRRHQVDTIVEGVGINRQTANLQTVLNSEEKWIEDAISVSDREVVLMSRYMVEYEGLFLGSSSCVNLVAAVKYARRNPPCPEEEGSNKKRKRIVTMLCDGGHRHLTKFWNDKYISDNGILDAPGYFQRAEFEQELESLSFIR